MGHSGKALPSSGRLSPDLSPVSPLSATSIATSKWRTSSISASSQYPRPVSPINNFSRPTSPAPPVPQLPRIPPQPPLPLRSDLHSSIRFDNGHGFTDDWAQRPTARRYESPNQLRNADSRPAYVKEQFTPNEAYPRIPVPQRESFDISDVSGRVAHPQRAAYVQSMAVSTHGAQSLCSARISRVQDDDGDWCETEPVERPLPLKPRSPSPISRARAQTSSQQAACTSSFGAGSLDRAFTFPDPIQAASESVHPSSRILLSYPSPRVRALMTTRRGLLTALETATLPRAAGAEPILWWQAWPEAKSLNPIRTLDLLRTSNVGTTPVSGNNAPTPGQGTHFARLTPFRFCTRTRTHGPETDFSHPSFCGSVASRRALWIAAYREANYNAPLSSFDAAVVLARPRMETPWQGHWLQRGTARGVCMRDERREGGEHQEAHHGHGNGNGNGGYVKCHKRGWSTQSVQSTVHSIKRAGNKVSRRWASFRRNRKQKPPKRKYTPLPLDQDVSGWYSDSSE